MFFSLRSLIALTLVLVGLIFGLGWYLTKLPSTSELGKSQTEALTYLLRSRDEDSHFIPRFALNGSVPSVTRAEQFSAELAAATALAAASRDDSTLAEAHRGNLGIILTDWYTSAGGSAYLTNGSPAMEQNGRGLELLAASPLFEEQRDKAEKLAAPIAAWTREDFSMYWKGASTTPAESLGYGILGIGSLYLRTGSSEHKETLERLAERYRLLLDVSPLRLSVRAILFQALAQDEDRRALLLSANTFLPLQNKNPLSSSYGLFKDSAGAYYPAPEQAMIIEGLAQASALVQKTDSQTSLSLKQATLRSAGALLRVQTDASSKLSGGILQDNFVDTYATARFIEALEILKQN